MIHMIEFHAMGCQVSIQLMSDEHGGAILQEMHQEIARIEAALTRFKPDSELMQLNSRAGMWVTVSELLFENIHAAKNAALLTDGLYNPLILPALIANGYAFSFEQLHDTRTTESMPAPDWQGIQLHASSREVFLPADSAIDLGGIAKGWTAEYLADHLSQYGACLVNIGGDIVGRGASDGLQGWQVDIEDPFTSDVYTSIRLHNSSVASSGLNYRNWRDRNGQKYHHIIDPRTGNSADTDILSVTVSHPDAGLAEAYSKAVILRGADDGLNWLNQQWHTAGLVFKQDGSVLATSNFIILTQ